MRKSKAKQGIVNTAEKLIKKKGYSSLNVTDIAYVAKVSVGTLYYHFPKGKVDILAEIMSQRVEGSLEDTLRWFFKKVIELRRPDRYFLSAIQSEMLDNPSEYMAFVKKYQSTDGLQQAMGVLSEALVKAAKSEAGGIGKVLEKQERIQRVVGLLMSYQIIFPDYFGDDDEFVDLALRIFFEILKS
ncbi:MAG: TetR/AcrR family transcriptional regulator [Candidatus Thorarchaeota archaeon]|jgi:AcrR family transcriptional regulator